MNILEFSFRLSVKLPFLDLSRKITFENSVHNVQRSFPYQIIILWWSDLSLTWFISESILLDSSLLNLREIRSNSASSIRSVLLKRFSILIDHKERSEHIQFIILSNVVKHLFDLYNNCGIKSNTFCVHVVLHSPEWFLNVNLSIKR
jgi:hypothetical protein